LTVAHGQPALRETEDGPWVRAEDAERELAEARGEREAEHRKVRDAIGLIQALAEGQRRLAEQQATLESMRRQLMEADVGFRACAEDRRRAIAELAELRATAQANVLELTAYTERLTAERDHYRMALARRSARDEAVDVEPLDA
jgi:hypothetical protein